MGFSVGVTTLKLTRKMSTKARKRRSGKLEKIACEALAERRTKDPDVNPELTKYNEYVGIRSGEELTRRLTEEAEEYSQRRQAQGRRGLRSTASIGYAVIVKPEMSAIMGMTPDERRRFFRDSQQIVDGILDPDGKNLRARVLHRDELAWHTHSFYAGWVGDEICVDKLINPAAWGQINREYPARMRARGWDVQDCDCYDAARAERDPAYREARREKRRKHGRDSTKYKREQREAQLQAWEDDLHAEAAQLKEQEVTLKEQLVGVRLARAELDLAAREYQHAKRQELTRQIKRTSDAPEIEFMKKARLSIGGREVTMYKLYEEHEADQARKKAAEEARLQAEAEEARRQAAARERAAKSRQDEEEDGEEFKVRHPARTMDDKQRMQEEEQAERLRRRQAEAGLMRAIDEDVRRQQPPKSKRPLPDLSGIKGYEHEARGERQAALDTPAASARRIPDTSSIRRSPSSDFEFEL